uniref:HRd n=1 Tax=Brassica napus TaxID=3708 RepID=A0A024BSI0_BRANA|nr:HRd [Brassica napus]
MVIELMAGAALGLALQVVHEAIKKAIERSLSTRYILYRLEDTISRITTFVAQVDKLSEEVEDSPRKIIEDLKNHLDNATSLLKAYAELRRRNLIKKYRCRRSIKELEASLRCMINVDVQVNHWDIKKLMATMSETNTKLQPTDCFKSKHCISQSSNQHIFKARDPSSEERAECLSDEPKPKIDIHIRWSSRKRNKDRDIRFTIK